MSIINFIGIVGKLTPKAVLDKKTSVPLIPEFREYVLDELQKRGVLKENARYSLYDAQLVMAEAHKCYQELLGYILL